jgi:hypothetical protein
VEVHTTTIEDLPPGWSLDTPQEITPQFQANPYSTDDNPPEDPNWDNNVDAEQFTVMPPGWLG